MRIARVEVFDLAAPLAASFQWSTGSAGERAATLVRITAEDGVAGWGEALDPAAGPLIAGRLGPLLLGASALERGALAGRLRAAARAAGATAAVSGSAAGAVDIALADLAARAAGLPLHRLLGAARRDRVGVYASGIYYSANGVDPGAEARGYLAGGFTRVKMKIGRLTPGEDLARIAAVRRAVGPGTPLMVDANRIYDPATAVELAAGLEELGVAWLEEPLASDRLAGYRTLKARSAVRLAAGENLAGRRRFAPFLAARLLDVAQPNLSRAGGLDECLAIARRARRAGAQIALHGWGTPVLVAAALHLACCLPDEPEPPLVEIDCTPNPLRRIVVGPPWTVEDGAIRVPDGPGLGLVPDEEALARFRRKPSR